MADNLENLEEIRRRYRERRRKSRQNLSQERLEEIRRIDRERHQNARRNFSQEDWAEIRRLDRDRHRNARQHTLLKPVHNTEVIIKEEHNEKEEESEEQYIEYLEDDTAFAENEEPTTSSSVTCPKAESSSECPSQDTIQEGQIPTFIACEITKKRRLSEIVSEEEQLQQSRESNYEEDECDAFGKYISMSLKRLPLHLSIQAQREIQDSLTRFRLLAITPTDTDVVDNSANIS